MKGGETMTNKRRIISILMILLIVFVLVSSFWFILHETHHDCTGEDCPVCAMIAICRNTLKTVLIALLLVLSALASRSAGRAFVSSSAQFDPEETPVSLKVKLLN